MPIQHASSLTVIFIGLLAGLRLDAASASPLSRNAPNGFQYELHFTAANYPGAMATCQSRASGQGVLSPLATVEELATVAALLFDGCLLRDDLEDELFFIGLTSLGNRRTLGWLDRPRPGSSTSLLRSRALPGQGFINGLWPDDPELTGTVSASPAQPLCAAVRVLVATQKQRTSAAPADEDGNPPQFVAACSGAFRQLMQQSPGTLTSYSTYRIEVNFQVCDGGSPAQDNQGRGVTTSTNSGGSSNSGDTNSSGDNGNANSSRIMHPFVCRLPAVRPPPSPRPSPPPLPKRPPVPAPGKQPPQPQPQAPLGLPSPELPPPELPPPPPQPPVSPSRRRTATEADRMQRALLQLQEPPPLAQGASQPIAAQPPPLHGQHPPVPAPGPPGMPPVPSLEELRNLCDELTVEGSNRTAAYLVCRIPAGWSEATSLCEELLEGGELAVLESEAQIAALRKFILDNVLGAELSDFWFGLVSGYSATQPSVRQAVPLEYVLTDPRVPATYLARLWDSGALRVHNTCAVAASPRPPPGPPLPPPARPPPQPQPLTGEQMDDELRRFRRALADVVGAAPYTDSRTGISIDDRPAASVRRRLQAAQNTTATASELLPLPHPGGCCASLGFPPSRSGAGNGSSLLLRSCAERVHFVCQAWRSVAPSSPADQGADGEATTLTAGLFLDAMDAGYSGARRTFRALVQMTISGVSYSNVVQADAGVAERFMSDTIAQLSRSTRIPAASFEVVSISPGSVVLRFKLMLYGLPRATTTDLWNFLSTCLVNRQLTDLFAADYIATWGAQGVSSQIVSYENLTPAPPPSPPADDDSDGGGSNTQAIIIGTVVGGTVLLLGIVTGLIVQRRWQRSNSVTVSGKTVTSGSLGGSRNWSETPKAPPAPPLGTPPAPAPLKSQPSAYLRQSAVFSSSPSGRLSAGLSSPARSGGAPLNLDAPWLAGEGKAAAGPGSSTNGSGPAGLLAGGSSTGLLDSSPGSGRSVVRGRPRLPPLDVSGLGMGVGMGVDGYPLGSQSPNFAKPMGGAGDGVALSLAGSPLSHPRSFRLAAVSPTASRQPLRWSASVGDR